MIRVNAEKVEQLLHGDTHRRAAAPDTDDEMGPEAALQDLLTETKGVVQKLLGTDVLLIRRGVGVADHR